MFDTDGDGRVSKDETKVFSLLNGNFVLKNISDFEEKKRD